MKANKSSYSNMYLESTQTNTKKKRNTLVFGAGVNDWEYVSYTKGKPVWQYRIWGGVLERCFSEKLKLKQPYYRDTTCDERWLSFKAFIADIINVEKYERFYTDKWCIDKDLLIKGNNVYSKDTVCFIPQEINNFITKSNSSRGLQLIGVHFNKRQQKFTASVSNGAGEKLHLGTFSSEIDAFNSYKMNKERIAKALANKWKGIVANNVYEALMNYEVSIND